MPIPALVGLWPLTSYKQALRLNNEVPGIVIPPATLARNGKGGRCGARPWIHARAKNARLGADGAQGRNRGRLSDSAVQTLRRNSGIVRVAVPTRTRQDQRIKKTRIVCASATRSHVLVHPASSEASGTYGKRPPFEYGAWDSPPARLGQRSLPVFWRRNRMFPSVATAAT